MEQRDKAAWRRRARQVRGSIAIDHGRHCEALADFARARPGHVLIFDAMEGEVDLSSLATLDGLGPLAITRTPDSGSVLTIHPYGGPVERHRYGFAQPPADAPIVADADVSVVAVPGLAFDRGGNRLGRGAGYYDRLLSRLLARSATHAQTSGEADTGVAIVGMTGGYVVAELPTERHDVAMTHLCGEFGVLPVPLADPDG